MRQLAYRAALAPHIISKANVMMENAKRPALKIVAGHRKQAALGRGIDRTFATRPRGTARIAEQAPSSTTPDHLASLDIPSLFEAWNALQTMLRRATLPDSITDRFVDRARDIMVAMAAQAARDWSDIVLKLALYRRELAAGPSEDCDALLASALEDCAPIFRRGEHLDDVEVILGLAAATAREHRRELPPEQPTFHVPRDPR